MNKKYSYKQQLRCIKNAKQSLKIVEDEISKYEYKLYGSKDSPFYGLKYPTLFKICEYICDEYKIPYDLMMDKIYHMLMKQQYESSFKFINYDVYPPSLDDGIPYGWDARCHWEERSFLNKTFNEYRLFKKLKKGYLRGLSNKKDLYLGSIPYRTMETRNFHTNRLMFISDATYKSKKQVSDEGICSTLYANTITKQKIIEELNKLGIEYKLNMKKNELMKLLVKNQ